MISALLLAYRAFICSAPFGFPARFPNSYFTRLTKGGAPAIVSACFAKSWAFVATRQSGSASQNGKHPSGARDSLIHRLTRREQGKVLGWRRLRDC